MNNDWARLKHFEKLVKEAGVEITVPPFKMPLSVVDESLIDGEGKVVAVLCFQELPEKIERGRKNAKWIATAINSLFGFSKPVCDWEEPAVEKKKEMSVGV